MHDAKGPEGESLLMLKRILAARVTALGLVFLLAACASDGGRQGEITRADAEIAPLRAEIARKDAEIERLQYSIGILGQEIEELRRLVARLQSTVQVAPLAAEAAEPAPPTPEPAPAAEAEAEAEAKPESAPAPQPEPGPRENAAPAATSGAFAIHLASYGSPQSAAAGWRKLSGDHPELMAGLEPRYTVLEIAGGPYYRLIAGRFDDREEAARRCAKIEPVNGFCIVTFFGGEPLP